MSEENGITTVAMTNRGVLIHNIDEAWRFCTAIEKSGIAPKGMSTAAIFAVVQSGAELGLTPFRALANMKIINGRVGPMGSLAKAMVRQANVLAPRTGFKEEFIGIEGTDEYAARIVTRRAGESNNYVTTFSVKDAKRAALWGKSGPWTQYPRRMLMWRAVGFHMDDFYSDVLMGFHIAEVLADYPEERIKAVMEPQAVTVKDPLLEELAEIAATMQPPDPIEDPGYVDPDTGEVLDTPIDYPIEEPMTEEEAMADLIRDGLVEMQDEDLSEPDPSNAAEEGSDQEVLF